MNKNNIVVRFIGIIIMIVSASQILLNLLYSNALSIILFALGFYLFFFSIDKTREYISVSKEKYKKIHNIDEEEYKRKILYGLFPLVILFVIARSGLLNIMPTLFHEIVITVLYVVVIIYIIKKLQIINIKYKLILYLVLFFLISVHIENIILIISNYTINNYVFIFKNIIESILIIVTLTLVSILENE